MEMQLPPPWRPVEFLNGATERDWTPLIDVWSFATTVAEISQWCVTSKKRLGYPEDTRHFNREEKEKYSTCNVVENWPAWMEDLNPNLIQTLRNCWRVQPMSRTPYNVILREFETAKFNARQNDDDLSMPIPTNASGKLPKILDLFF